MSHPDPTQEYQDPDMFPPCPVCNLTFNVEDPQQEHEEHLEQACHELDITCATCEDSPLHCSYGFSSMVDRAKDMHDDNFLSDNPKDAWPHYSLKFSTS